MDDKLSSFGFISVARSCSWMAGHCMVKLVITEDKRKKGSLLMSVEEDGGNNNCSVCWRCKYHLKALSGGVCQSNGLCVDDIIDDDALDAALFTSLILHPLSHRRVSVLTLP